MTFLPCMQERELRDKCEDVARRLWFAKWSTAAAAVKAARLRREREDAALAAVDVSLGRLRGNNKRSLAVADSSHGHGAAAGVTEWERQVRSGRGLGQGVVGAMSLAPANGVARHTPVHFVLETCLAISRLPLFIGLMLDTATVLC